MLNFCTLFDSNYLSRGLALYESLMASCPNSHLYIFAFDDVCYQILQRLSLTNATIIALEELESSDNALLQAKKTRTPVEYCWTCTPAIILYSIQKFHLNVCTYLDADLYFFSSPQVLLDELSQKSILITSHRYTPEYNQEKASGKYCVQFMTFKNDTNGMIALNWWHAACIDWCYNRVEDGKLGDQKYLDDWPVRFDGVHELEHLGGGVAPWNVQQYEFFKTKDVVAGKKISSNIMFELVFYHFHSLKFLTNERVHLGGYFICHTTIQLIYAQYITHLEKIKMNLGKINPLLDPHGKAKNVYNVGVRNKIKQNISFVKNSIMKLMHHSQAKKYCLRKPNIFQIKRIVEQAMNHE